MEDVIIIGKGPAGISAALYTVRANLRTMIIGGDTSALKKADKIENYYGFGDPVRGQDLLTEGEKCATRIGAEILEDMVVGIDPLPVGFKVKVAGRAFAGRTVLIATGQDRKKIVAEGVSKFEGMGISYCTTCDGFFYRKKTVGIVGSGAYALHEAEELKAFTDDITIFSNGDESILNGPEALGQYKLNTKRIKQFVGDEVLEGVVFEDGSTTPVDGMFIVGETASGLDFARKMGIQFEGSSIVVDKDQKTSIEGIFAAGDCTGGFKQIATAVGQGAVAGKSLIEYVRRTRKK